MRCKAIRPICRSASFAPTSPALTPRPHRRPLAIISPLGTSSLPLFFIAASKLESVAKVRASGGGYKRRPGGCGHGAASHCPPLPDHPHLHPHRLEMVSTQGRPLLPGRPKPNIMMTTLEKLFSTFRFG